MPETFVLTDDERTQTYLMQQYYPYRLIYVARKADEKTIISAVPTMRIPNKLVREGWQVAMISKG